MGQPEMLKDGEHRVLRALFAAGGGKKSTQHTMFTILQHFGLTHIIAYLTQFSTILIPLPGFNPIGPPHP